MTGTGPYAKSAKSSSGDFLPLTQTTDVVKTPHQTNLWLATLDGEISQNHCFPRFEELDPDISPGGTKIAVPSCRTANSMMRNTYEPKNETRPLCFGRRSGIRAADFHY